MKPKNTIFVFGAALAVSFGVLSSAKNAQVVRADIIDIGTISFSEANGDSTINMMFGINWTENVIPTSWTEESSKFAPVDENSGTFVDGVRVGTEMKKIGPYTYYIPVANVQVGSVAVCKGTWANDLYRFTVKDFVQKWDGKKWQKDFIPPELEPYDKVTLVDTCFDDQDKVRFDSTYLEPCVWNTYVTSEENTRNSFSVEFEFEAYGAMTTELTIKAGNSGPYDQGHFYKLAANNTWGTSGGVIVLFEMNKDGSVAYRTSDLTCNLNPGARHTIEFGSIYVKDSDDTYNFVKYDGEFLYRDVVTPSSHERTTKVGYYYGGTNIFLGSSHEQKENTQILRYNRLSENKNGIYLDGSINNIPADWEVKGVPASKYNALINGQPMYQFGSGYPMAKPSAEEDNAYYLDLAAGNVSLKEGDVITLSDEFHFYADNKAYSMSVVPVSFLYSKNQMSQINNIYSFMSDKIENRCDPEYYDEDKLVLIEEIVDEAKEVLPTEKNMKKLWDMYLNYLEELDAIPYNEEKAREILEKAKTEAIATLNALADPDKYTEANYLLVKGLIDAAIDEIEDETTDTPAKVEEIVESYKLEIANVETKQQSIENEILNSNKLLEEYLDKYDVITTTDLSAVGDMVFRDSNENSYRSGNYDDTTTRFANASDNPNGNYIFQAIYQSDDPNARVEGYGAQIFIRARTTADNNCFRFDIATAVDGAEGESGVGIAKLENDIAVGRKVYNAKLQKDTPYIIECGVIDLKEYDRTLVFMKINGEFVLKAIYDSLPEQVGTFRIMDSLVPTPHEARLSPLELGTSKENNSTLIGRPILDSSSDKDALILTLRDNDIPVGAILYPNEEGAFLLNGEEIEGNRPQAYLQKTSQYKYVVLINNYKFSDGDEIYLGEFYSIFNAETLVKSSYKFFETTLTYDEETNSWSQEEPTDPVVIISEAKDTIRYYVDINNYSQTSQDVINSLINEYILKIDEAESIEEIPYIVEEALEKIREVPTLLDDYKEEAKVELGSYVDPNDYRKEEKDELIQILEDAYKEIDGCSDVDSIDLVVAQTKLDINALKTAEERDAEDLANYKKEAVNDVQAYSALLEMNRYTDENAGLLVNMTYAALDDIDKATSIQEVERIVNEYKEAVKKVSTKDGSTFDGEKYIEKPRSGCGGSVETVSILSFVALIAAALLLLVKRFKKEN